MKAINPNIPHFVHISLIGVVLLYAIPGKNHAQTTDSIQNGIPATTIDIPESQVLPAEKVLTPTDSLLIAKSNRTLKVAKRDWNTWHPNAKRALWLSIVLPGAGQIYNRKYWKLPIVYGGVVGCAYAMQWNNQMYHDYSQAYMDLVDNDPQSHSYDQFLHLGNKIDDSNKARFEELFRKRKDRYRRWRDLSFFTLIGVYALSVIDAYVDASLSEFDISNDLSLRVEPTIFNNHSQRNPIKSGALGIQCSLRF